MRLAQATTDDGEVLAEHEHLATVDVTVTGDDAIAEVTPFLAETAAPAALEHVELLEGAGVQEQAEPLPGGQFAPAVLRRHLLFAAGGDGFLAQPLQCLECCLVLRIHACHLVMEAAAGRDRAAGGFAVDDHPSLFAPRSPGPVLPEGAGRRPTGRILIPIGELFTASFTGKKGRVQTL